MKIYTYQNNRNSHKYIEVHSYEEGHYSWKQFIRTATDSSRQDLPKYLISIVGSTCRQPLGYFSRISKKTMDEVLEDYTFVQEGTLIR